MNARTSSTVRALLGSVVIISTLGLSHKAVSAPDSPASVEADKKPNPVKSAAGKAAAALRADDDMKAVLDAMAATDPKAIEKLTPLEARTQPTAADAVKTVLQKQGRDADPVKLVPGIATAEKMVAGAAGELPATIYTPSGAGPFPVIVYFHGGGWVIADRKVYDAGARGLAKAAQAIVVSVDYRRAPEAKFPAQWDDALASYRWVASNAASFNGDPAKLALAGESAGGNLAVATAVAARDSGAPKPLAIVAVYPVAQTGSLSTVSYLENAVAQPLSRAMIPWFLDKVLRSEDDKKDTRLDLVHARLDGLPPVTIINARLDPLRSDGSMLEDALKKAKVPVERKDYAGVSHEFFGMAAVVAKAKEAQDYAGARLKAAWAAAPKSVAAK